MIFVFLGRTAWGFIWIAAKRSGGGTIAFGPWQDMF